MNEMFDIVRFIALNKKRSIYLFVGGIVGTIVLSVLFAINVLLISKQPEYCSKALYYITFDTDEFEAVHDYYNDFTWNDVIDSDLIAGKASDICGISKVDIALSTRIPTMSDIRMFWLYVEGDEAEKVSSIQDAMGKALEAFAENQEGFSAISIMDGAETVHIVRSIYSLKVCISGAVLGVIAGFMCMLYKNATDAGIYTLSDSQKYAEISTLMEIFSDGSIYRGVASKVYSDCIADKGNIAIYHSDLAVDFKDKIAALEIDSKIEVFECTADTVEKISANSIVLVPVKQGFSGYSLKKIKQELECANAKKVYCIIYDGNKNLFNSIYRGK